MVETNYTLKMNFSLKVPDSISSCTGDINFIILDRTKNYLVQVTPFRTTIYIACIAKVISVNQIDTTHSQSRSYPVTNL